MSIQEKNEKHDFVIGLDLIQEFKLNLNYNLEVFQSSPFAQLTKNKKEVSNNEENLKDEFQINWNEAIPIH